MRRTIRTLCGGTLLLLAAACSSDKPAPPPTPAPDGPVQTVTYTASDELFPNPERGFYRYSINTDELTEHEVRECRSEDITLIYRFYYLKKFRGGAPLSGALLSQIDADMAVLRRAGGKAIVRFAYSNSGTEPDAPLAVILRHLEQLRPVLQRNKDVIAVLQAGFIGAWGEWHSSKNGLDTDAARRAILDKLLDVVPTERFVQVRKPAYKRTYVGIREALPQAEAFGRSARARIGLHNDCFLSGKNDVGTYTDVAEEKAYLHDEGLYVPMGGETCHPARRSAPLAAGQRGTALRHRHPAARHRPGQLPPLPLPARPRAAPARPPRVCRALGQSSLLGGGHGLQRSGRDHPHRAPQRSARRPLRGEVCEEGAVGRGGLWVTQRRLCG